MRYLQLPSRKCQTPPNLKVSLNFQFPLHLYIWGHGIVDSIVDFGLGGRSSNPCSSIFLFFLKTFKFGGVWHFMEGSCKYLIFWNGVFLMKWSLKTFTRKWGVKIIKLFCEVNFEESCCDFSWNQMADSMSMKTNETIFSREINQPLRHCRKIPLLACSFVIFSWN